MEADGMCDAFNKALDLEIEGYWFYIGCSQHTDNEAGQKLFKHLADEEKVHYDKVAEIYGENFETEFCEYEKKKKEPSGIFEEKVPGGSINEKSDALDALNIAVRAEENSIDLYKKMSGMADDHGVKVFFEKLVKEEEKHRSILEAEQEFITETGEFRDFRTVTM